MNKYIEEIYIMFNTRGIPYSRKDISYMSYDTLLFAGDHLLEATKYGATKTLANAIDALYRVS